MYSGDREEKEGKEVRQMKEGGMDLTGWAFIDNFAFSLEIWGEGDRRVLVDKNTKELVIEYSMCRANKN